MSEECPVNMHSGCVPNDILLGINQEQSSTNLETILEVTISGFDEGTRFQIRVVDETLQEDVIAPQVTSFVFPYAAFRLPMILINGRQYSARISTVNPDPDPPTLVANKIFYANFFNPIPQTCETGSHLECVSDAPPTLLEQVTTVLDNLESAGVINQHHRDAFIIMFSKLIELAQ